MFGHCLEGDFNKSRDSHFIYPDPTVLPPENQTETDRKVLTAFDVPPGHRVLSHAYTPICTMGYAVTQKGAQRMLYKFGLSKLGQPIDIEIMVACQVGELRCLEVNPSLIGVYRPGGKSAKVSDILAQAEPDAEIPRQNPMGERSVKSLLRTLLADLPESYEEFGYWPERYGKEYK